MGSGERNTTSGFLPTLPYRFFSLDGTESGEPNAEGGVWLFTLLL